MIETDIKKYIRMAFDTQDEGIVDRLSSKAGLETVLRGDCPSKQPFDLITGVGNHTTAGR